MRKEIECREMKQKYIYIIIIMMLVLTGCGTNKSSNLDTNNEGKKVNGNQVGEKEETNVKDKEDYNWKGIIDRYGYTVEEEGGISIEIKYPSLKPAAGGCAYQMDPALVLVTGPGIDSNFKAIRVSDLESTLTTSKDAIIMNIENYRNYQYENFDFIIEAKELMTINDLEVCKYTGKHTYTLDGVAQEIPFVAYSVDTKQVKNTYPTILVMDDSINNTSMKPLAKGTIEIYARKMVESIVISN